ncbi:hypothetical protein [Sedimentitalea nanhaiensis]|uniref:Antifreeze protein n=1 Tax=Sedimentitalea nanhaiensis TaxID=999627 RepID=A0A1I6YDJ8_9RHOB|nr:hypothetical protein [Sedimentitalea nanhaiensis]SFT48411.1 hypothetical protein SAMN05216236_102154 [Sedimentitalea nanhaiensis]
MHETIDRASDMAKTWNSVAQMTVDTQCIVAMRLWGMSGTWSVPPGECDEMIREKAPAFTEALVAGVLTALNGRGPDRVMQAVIGPLSDRTIANRARLADRGPRCFGFGQQTE